jgi:photosystem II Psb28-2 protein
MTPPDSSTPPSIQFFEGISEALSDVSLRRNRTTGDRIVVMTFTSLKAIERFQSYTSRFAKALCLTDCEGTIEIQPSSTKFIFGGDEGDDLKRVECRFEINQDEHWERFTRFMERYADANEMEYGTRD